MREVFKNHCFLLLSLCFFTGCGNAPQLARDPNSITHPAAKEVLDSLSTEESSFLVKINALRSSHGLSPLAIASDLQKAARAHSDFQNDSNTMSHYEGDQNSPNYTPTNRIVNEGGAYNATAENVACGSSTAEGVYQQWLHSAGQLRNMLSTNYQFIGIARAGTDQDQQTRYCPFFWTTDFGGIN